MIITDLTNNNNTEYVAECYFDRIPPHQIIMISRISDGKMLYPGEFEVIEDYFKNEDDGVLKGVLKDDH